MLIIGGLSMNTFFLKIITLCFLYAGSVYAGQEAPIHQRPIHERILNELYTMSSEELQTHRLVYQGQLAVDQSNLKVRWAGL